MSEQERISELIRTKLATTLPDLGLAKIATDRALMDYLAGALTQEAIAASPALYNSLAQSLTLPVSEIALAEARTMAADRAATLVTDMTRSELRAIGETVAEGLKRGDGVLDIARNLDHVTELNAPQAKKLDKYINDMRRAGVPPAEIEKRAARLREHLLRERREMIAQAEARYAVEEAHRVEALAAGKRYKAWISSRDERVSDGCAENEAAGWIPIETDFPSGHGEPPRHPRCRCSAAYRGAAPDELAEERHRLRKETTAAARGE